MLTLGKTGEGAYLWDCDISLLTKECHMDVRSLHSVWSDGQNLRKNQVSYNNTMTQIVTVY